MIALIAFMMIPHTCHVHAFYYTQGMLYPYLWSRKLREICALYALYSSAGAKTQRQMAAKGHTVVCISKIEN